MYENINHLNDDELNNLLLLRKENNFKFNQLQSDMYFLTTSGHDDFENKIVSINSEKKLINYIDLSLPDFDRNFGKIQTTHSHGWIPFDLYLNEEDLRNRKKFIFRELDENQIMQLHNLTDFEKTLFLQYQNNQLIKILKVWKHKFNSLVHEFDNQIFTNTDSKKVRNQKTYITNLENKLKQFITKDEISTIFIDSEKFVKNKNDVLSDEQKIKLQKEQINIWIDKCTKWKELYINLLEKVKS